MSSKLQHTDFFSAAGWGVFTHYLPIYVGIATGKPDPVDEWNARVDNFDVKGLASQLESVGAGFYFITIGQNSGFYCAPNETYDEYVGIKPSKCSHRDLVSDIYEELAPRGIDLLVYLPAGAPASDAVAVKALEWAPGSQTIGGRPSSGQDEQGRPWGSLNPRLVNFQRKWEAIIADWSRRWGSKVRGWWFDGCYYPAMYEYPEPPNWSSFLAAARAGNPDSIVAFNPGVIADMPILTEQQDYTAGEVSDKFPPCDKFPPPCQDRWLHGVQWHILSYLGTDWCTGDQPRLSDEFVSQYTREAVEHGGVVTWDVPILPSGLIPDSFVAQLKVIGQGVSDL